MRSPALLCTDTLSGASHILSSQAKTSRLARLVRLARFPCSSQDRLQNVHGISGQCHGYGELSLFFSSPPAPSSFSLPTMPVVRQCRSALFGDMSLPTMSWSTRSRRRTVLSGMIRTQMCRPARVKLMMQSADDGSTSSELRRPDAPCHAAAHGQNSLLAKAKQSCLQ